MPLGATERGPNTANIRHALTSSQLPCWDTSYFVWGQLRASYSCQFVIPPRDRSRIVHFRSFEGKRCPIYRHRTLGGDAVQFIE